MSKLKKLKIRNIRGFGDDWQTIRFFEPLTVISGVNGSGKTSIIEVLRFATTGEYPPGTDSGKSFVHESGSRSTVRGEIALELVTAPSLDSGTRQCFIVSRILEAGQGKEGKRSCRKGEVKIDQVEGDEVIPHSTRCVKTNILIPTLLGAPSALLNSVIFCHQDESLWPIMSTPADLKRRFDEIFSTSEYALASKKLADRMKEMNTRWNVIGSKLAPMKALADQRQIAKGEKLTLEREALALKRQIQKRKRHQERLRQKVVEVQRLQKELETKKNHLKWLQNDIQTREGSSGQLADGETLEFLNMQLSEFQGEFSVIRTKYESVSKQVSEFETQIQSWTDEKNRKEVDLRHARDLVQKETIEVLKGVETAKKVCQNWNLSVDSSFVEALGEINVHNVDRVGEKDVDDKCDLSPFQEYFEKMEGNLSRLFERERAKSRKVRERIGVDLQNLEDRCRELEQNREEKKFRSESMSKDTAERRKKASEIRTKVSAMITESEFEALKQRVAEAEIQLKAEMQLHDLVQKRSTIEEMRKTLLQWTKKDRELREELKKYELLREKQSIRRHNENELKEDAKKVGDVESQLNEIGTSGSTDLALRIADLRVACEESSIDPTKVVSVVNGTKRSLERWIKSFAEIRREHAIESEKCATGLRECEYQLRNAKSRLHANKKKLISVTKKIAQCEWSEEELCAPTFLRSLEDEMDRLKKDASVLEVMEEVFSRYLHQMESDRCCPLCCKKLSDGGYHELEDRIHEKRGDLPSMIEKHAKDIEAMEDRLELARVVSPLAMEASEFRAAIAEDEEILSSQEEKLEELEEKGRVLRQSQQQHECLQESLSQLERNLTSMETRLDSILAAASADMSNMEAVEQEASRVKDFIDKVNTDIIAQQNEYDKISRIVQSKTAEVDTMKQELERHGYQLSRRKELEGEIVALEEVISRNVSEHEICERDYHEFTRKASESRSKYEDMRDRSEKKQREMADRLKRCENDWGYFREFLKAHADYFAGKLVSNVARLFQDLKCANERLGEVQDGKRALSNELVQLQRSIDNEESRKHAIEEKIGLATKTNELEAEMAEVHGIEETLLSILRDEEGNVLKHGKIVEEYESEKEMITRDETDLKNKEEQIAERQRKINHDDFRDAEEKYRKNYIEHYVLADAIKEMKDFKDALDRAQIRFHEVKMGEINRTIHQLWTTTYRADDIDTILIQSNEEGRGRSSYEYSVVMKRRETCLDMRGRCSAGQKMLASIIIRLALAYAFAADCGVLALDEPTTNLSTSNREALASSIIRYMERPDSNGIQILVITHDNDFVQMLGKGAGIDEYYVLRKERDEEHPDDVPVSRIYKQHMRNMHDDDDEEEEEEEED